ncbi:unnamed protein product, partial [Rotaria sp. Silwood1]
MHRPGRELLRRPRDNYKEILYNGVLHLMDAHRSHDLFTQYLRGYDIQVLYMTDLLQETLVSSKQAHESLIDSIVSRCSSKEFHQSAKAKTALEQWLHERTPLQLADDIVHGVACSPNELGSSNLGRILLEICDSTTNEFVIPPSRDALYTRDAFSVIENNVFIWKVANFHRKCEPLIYRTIFQYHPYLSISGLNLIEWEHLSDDPDEATVEGGDVAYLGDGVLLIGCGERTNRAGIEAIARTNLFHRIIVAILPVQHEYMHLDTILSSVSTHAFALHYPLANIIEVFTIETEDEKKNTLEKLKWISHGSNIRQALRRLLNNPHLIFYDALDKKTSIQEQRNCRFNVLAINECHVVTYAGGDATRGLAAAIKHNDTTCKVGLIPVEGLLEGEGGAHCMTNALRRHRPLLP